MQPFPLFLEINPHAISNSPLRTHYCSQASLVVSWQRISTQELYQSHCNCSIHESCLRTIMSVLPPILIQLPTPELDAILCCNCNLFLHIFADLNSRLNSNSKSKSKLPFGGRYTANQFILASSPFRLAFRDIFHLNHYANSPYVTSSLTRRWVCPL
jgi:hypothetical protein